LRVQWGKAQKKERRSHLDFFFSNDSKKWMYANHFNQAWNLSFLICSLDFILLYPFWDLFQIPDYGWWN